MKKIYKVFFVICLFFVLGNNISYGQLIDPEVLFKSKNLRSSGKFTGSPFVKIDGVTFEDETEPKGWFEEAKRRLLGENTPSQDIPQFTKTNLDEIKSATQMPQDYTVTSLYGKKEETVFVDHTTTFLVTAQIINPTDILVEENIQFISTTPLVIERQLPKTTNQNNTLQSISVLEVKKNSVISKFSQTESEHFLSLKDTVKSPAGTYNLQIKYIIKNAILDYNQKKGTLTFSITGTNWAFPVDRFRVLLLYPKKIPVFTRTLTFGSNHLSILNSYISKTDPKGNTFYTLTRPLPAFAAVTITEEFDSAELYALMPEGLSDKNFSLILTGLFLFISLLYLVFASFFLKIDMKNKMMKSILKMPFFVISYLKNTRLSYKLLINLKNRNHFLKKKSFLLALLIRLFPHKFLFSVMIHILKAYAVMFLYFKYIITQVLILLTVSAVIFFYHLPFILSYCLVSLLLIIMAHIIFFKLRFKKFLSDQLEAFENNMLKKSNYIGLSEKAINGLYLQYAPVLYTGNLTPRWLTVIKELYPDIVIKQFS